MADRRDRPGRQAALLSRGLRLRWSELRSQRHPGARLEHLHRAHLRTGRGRRVRARLCPDRRRLVPLERSRATGPDPAAGAASPPGPPSHRALRPGVRLLDRAHAPRVRPGGARRLPPLPGPDRSPRPVRSRGCEPGRLSALHEPGLEPRRRLLGLPGGPGPVLDPHSPDGRVPGDSGRAQPLPAHGVGTDSRHRRLLGDFARPPPLPLSEMDQVGGPGSRRFGMDSASCRTSCASASR